MKKKLFVATLVSYLGIYITMPVLSAISTKAHMIPSQIGIMISLGAAAMLLFAPIWGKMSDIFGRRIVMIIDCSGWGILHSLRDLVSYVNCVVKSSTIILLWIDGH